MKIDGNNCIACQSFVIYCPMEAIKAGLYGVYVDQDACIELGKQCTCIIFNTERAREIIQRISI